jgi:hypothetical protein
VSCCCRTRGSGRLQTDEHGKRVCCFSYGRREFCPVFDVLEAARVAREQGVGFWASVPTVDQGQAKNVSILCVRYNPDGKDAGNEYVTLQATTRTNLDLWWVVDANGHAVYLTGMAEAGQPFEILFTGDAVWNNDGDTAKLFDSRNILVDEFSYPGGGSEACR